MKKYMQERRVEPRFLCADLVNVQWRDPSGKRRRCTAVLEDISPSGACLQFERAMPLEVRLEIRHARGSLEGIVKYCVFRDIGYFVGMQFNPAHGWSSTDFAPQHLLDLRRLAERGSPKRKPN
jgi:hypothetical protein